MQNPIIWREGDTSIDELKNAAVSDRGERAPIHVTIGGETDWFIIKGVVSDRVRTGYAGAEIDAVRCDPPN